MFLATHSEKKTKIFFNFFWHLRFLKINVKSKKQRVLRNLKMLKQRRSSFNKRFFSYFLPLHWHLYRKTKWALPPLRSCSKVPDSNSGQQPHEARPLPATPNKWPLYRYLPSSFSTAPKALVAFGKQVYKKSSMTKKMWWGKQSHRFPGWND